MDKSQILLLEKLLAENKDIILIGHVNPDGDCIGALTGFHRYLKSININSIPVVPNAYPLYLEFLDSDKSIKIYENDKEYIDNILDKNPLLICMDFNSLKRLDLLGKDIKGRCLTKVLIDHHPMPEDEYDVVFSHTEMSSACEVTYSLIREMNGFNNLPLNCAISLYIGMMTDTNNFANSVSGSTFLMAVEL